MNILKKWSLSLGEKLRGLEFVDELDEDLYCGKCKLLLINPWQCEESRYCEKCLLEFGYVDGFPDKFALKQILTAKCFCKNKSKGCPWVGMVHEFEEHSISCEYMERKECQYAIVGCTFQGDNTQVAQHYQSSHLQHLSVISLTLSSEQNNELSDILQDTMKTLRKLSIGQRQYQDIFIQAKKIQERMEILTNSSEQSTSKIDNERLKTVNVIRTCLSIVEKLTEISKKESFLRKRFDDKKSAEEKKKFYRERKKEINEQTKFLFDLADANEREIQSIESYFFNFSQVSFDGYFLIKIANILEKIEAARLYGSNELSEYNSPFIYTHKYGHKLYLKVNFGTNVEATFIAPQYLSIFLVSVPGDYDEILTYPMSYSFEIRIKNFAGRQDKSYTLVPDPDKEFFQRALGEENMPIGFLKFISHEELLQKGYVADGAIFLEVIANDENENISALETSRDTGERESSSTTLTQVVHHQTQQ